MATYADANMPMVMDEDDLEDFAPTKTPEIDADDLERAILQHVQGGTQTAQGIMTKYRKTWERINRQIAAEFTDDDQDHPLVQQGHYHPKLYEFSRFRRQALMQKLIPDPMSMDFVEVMPLQEGMEEAAEMNTALLQKKLRIMRPKSASGLFDLIDDLAADWQDRGNALSLVGHEVYDGDMDHDEIIEGPVIERIDLMCWFPWSVTVPTVDCCPHSLFMPVDEDELDEIQNYSNVPFERDELVPDKTSRQSEEGDGRQNHGESFGEADQLHKRWVYLGPLPWREIAKILDVDGLDTRESVINAIESVYPYRDSASQHDNNWWVIEWIEGHLLCVKPYPVKMPMGVCPLVHDRFDRMPGCLIGRGLHELGSMDERLWNEFQRYLTDIAMQAANPPLKSRAGMIEEEWLAEHDGKVTVRAGETIPLKDSLDKNDKRDPLERMDVNIAALPIIAQQRDMYERNLRDHSQTQTTYQGLGDSGTATEAQNNMNQGLVPERYDLMRLENGLLKDLMLRCWVMTVEAVRLTGRVEQAPAPESFDEERVRMLLVTPDAVLSMRHYDVVLMGSSTPGTMMQQMALFNDGIDRWIDRGVADAYEAFGMWLKMMSIRGKHRLMAVYSDDDMQRTIMNLRAAFGQNAMSGLAPNAQRAGMRMLGQPGIPPMQQGLPADPGYSGFQQ